MLVLGARQGLAVGILEMAGEHQARQMGPARSEFPDEFQTIHSRHREIGDQGVDLQTAAELIERPLGAFRTRDDKACVFK